MLHDATPASTQVSPIPRGYKPSRLYYATHDQFPIIGGLQL